MEDGKLTAGILKEKKKKEFKTEHQLSIVRPGHARRTNQHNDRRGSDKRRRSAAKTHFGNETSWMKEFAKVNRRNRWDKDGKR